MARIENKEIKAAFEYVAHRDGRRCRYESPLCKGDLLLHHIDNNAENNNPSNWAIACRGHNARLNPRGRDARHKNQYIREWERGRGGGGYKQKEILAESKRMAGENGYDELAKKRTHSAEMEKNRVCEPAFRLWIEDMILKHGRVKAKELVNGGAEKVRCTQQTTGRYLDSMCSITGRFQYTKGVEDGVTYVEFKPEVAVLIYGNGKVSRGKGGSEVKTKP